MARVAVIGGSGHVGTYLVPRLVEAGYEVIVVSRGQRDPYQPHAAWNAVQRVRLDRTYYYYYYYNFYYFYYSYYYSIIITNYHY